jgi:ribonuclease III
MSDSRLEEAQKRIGYLFRDLRHLDEAVTHKSHVNEIRERGRKHNERLEFLGDAVLTLIMSEHLALTFPDFTEGELSKLKAQLVSEASLAQAARRMELGPLLRLGRGEELTQGRSKPSILANALEAIVAAVYLDGGLEAARAFVLRALLTRRTMRSPYRYEANDITAAIPSAATSPKTPPPRRYPNR